MAFIAGQKVICVRDWTRSGYGYGDEIGPVAGQIYTIRAIGFLAAPAYPELCVTLMEIANPTRRYVGGMYEPSFGTAHFRPLVERKTDISIFEAMLKTKKIDA